MGERLYRLALHAYDSRYHKHTHFVPDDIYDFWKQLSWQDSSTENGQEDENERLNVPEIQLREM